MQEEQENKNLNNTQDEIDLQEIFGVLLKGKRLIIAITFIMSTIGVIYSLSLPNVYKSKALLVPVNPANSIAGALGNYSSLAGLAGISLPGANANSNSEKAIKKISSLSLFENNILTNIYLPDLMAVESWNPEKNQINYDESIFMKENNSWKEEKPSPQKSFKVFMSQHLSLSVDKQTGFISLSVKHQSPYIAKEWAELVINEVNDFYRQKDKLESVRAVNYLNKQISMTDLSEIKQVMAQLLQEETKKLTLIEANQLYVFDYIDPPAVMEKKAEPSRSIICILFAFLGGIIGITTVLVRHYSIKKDEEY